MMTTRRRGVAIISVIALGGAALGPALAFAQPPRGGGPGGMQGGGRPPVSHGSVPRTFTGKPFSPTQIPRHFGSRPLAPRSLYRPFAPYGRFGAPIIYAAPYWGASVYYNNPAAYYSPPVYYQQPPTYYPSPVVYTPVAPPPPPVQNVIEFPHGRYELRGDGVSTPYTWVWIPAPPPPPPAAAPPTSGPDQPPSTGPREIYRWTDADGVLHLTDRLASVPERYRAKAVEAAQP